MTPTFYFDTIHDSFYIITSYFFMVLKISAGTPFLEEITQSNDDKTARQTN